jgi:hypothetical protein
VALAGFAGEGVLLFFHLLLEDGDFLGLLAEGHVGDGGGDDREYGEGGGGRGGELGREDERHGGRHAARTLVGRPMGNE